jgi:hypothetical protein
MSVQSSSASVSEAAVFLYPVSGTGSSCGRDDVCYWRRRQLALEMEARTSLKQLFDKVRSTRIHRNDASGRQVVSIPAHCSWRQWLRLVASALFLTACNDPNPSGAGLVERKWTEDVLLEDGEVIQVERSVAFRQYESWTGDARASVVSDATLGFIGDLSYLPKWRDRTIPLVLYQDKSTGSWVIVATTSSCDLWNWRNKPNPMYWEFRLDGPGWRETPLAATSIGRQKNLLHRYHARFTDPHVSVEDRKRLESSARMDKKYQSILPNSEINCM